MIICLENGKEIDTQNIKKAVWNPNSAGDGFFMSHMY